jgi:hypothetical protein
MVDPASNEVPGLGDTFSVELALRDSPFFVAGTGQKGEIGNGWYFYDAVSNECPTSGQVVLRVNGAGCMQQNLFANVTPLTLAGAGRVPVQYPVRTSSNVPVADCRVVVTIDAAGMNRYAETYTNAFGIATFHLDPGTWYFWPWKAGFRYPGILPDVEIVP